MKKPTAAGSTNCDGADFTVEFTPDRPGDDPFQCQMGMLRGKVVVTE